MPAVPQTKATWTNGVDALSSTNLHAYLRDPIKFLMRKPAAKLRQTVSQSFTTAVWASLNFAVEDLDDDPDGVGGHSTVTNTSRYTARYQGWYLCAGGVGWADNSTNRRGLRWSVNGSVVTSTEVLILATANSNVNAVIARPTLIRLDEGDYLELQAYQNSGGALGTLVGTDNQPVMNVTWDRLVVS